MRAMGRRMRPNMLYVLSMSVKTHQDVARCITGLGLFYASVCSLSMLACAPYVESGLVRQAPATAAASQSDTPRVLMVPPSHGLPRSGGERNMDFFTRGLHKLGHQVYVFTPAGPLARSYDDAGIPTTTPDVLRVAGEDGTRFETVVHAITAAMAESLRCADEGSCTAEAGARPLVPLLEQLDALLLPSTADDSDAESLALDDLDVPAPLLQALRLRRAAIRCHADVVFADLSRDAAAAVVGLAGSNIRVMWYPQMTEPEPSDAFLRLHTDVVTCGEGVRRYRFADAPQVAAVPNGVDTRRFTKLKVAKPRPPLLAAGGDDALIIANVASVDTRKNQKLLVQALGERRQDLGNAHLYFFGDVYDIAYQKGTVDLAHTLGVADRVHFVGSHADIEAYMPHFDIFVLPSLREGMPLSLLEAMSAEVACLASDIPGTQEMAGPGVAYFPPDDVATLGDALVDLAKDPERRRHMGVSARATLFERGFTTDVMLRNMSEQVTRAARL